MPLQDITQGTVIDLTKISAQKINLVADTANQANTGSVHFHLQGPITIDRWENNPIYTMATEPDHLDITANQFPIGDYTLTLVAYPLADRQGEPGPTKSFSFKVIRSTPSTPPAPSPGWTGSQGFTPITPSADSRLIYVSDSEGNDSNDCLSPAAPCKTINKGRDKLRNGYPDHLYLKRGDVFRQQILDRFPSGRSNAEPLVIAFYGNSGPRPKLENHSQSPIGRGDVRFIHVIGLEFSAYRLDPTHPEFTGSGSANIVMINNHSDFLFEDNKFNYVEMVVHDWTDRNTGVSYSPRNMTFRRNIWTGYYTTSSSYGQDPRPSNIYAKVKDNLSLIENVFDHGGWHSSIQGAGANMYNHNIYLQAGVVANILLKGNIITRGSSHGAQMRSGGLAEDNFFARNAIGLLIGYNVNLLPNGTRAHAINNVVSEGESMVKGVDPCQNNDTTNLCSRALWGLEFDLRGGNLDWRAHGNIVSLLGPSDQWRSMWTQLTVSAAPGLNGANVDSQNNIVWKWSLNPTETENTYPDPDRTLADYNAHLGGSRSFEAFINVVTNRPLQTWDPKYTAYAINDYIRAGFGQ